MIATGSEPQARRAATCGRSTRSVLLRSARRADDQVLTFLHIALQDLGGAAVAEAQHERHRLRLARSIDDPHASRRAAAGRAAARLPRSDLVVLRLLLRCEDRTNPGAGVLADFSDARLALAFRQV